MRNELVADLADCTEFRQALQARPPRVVHGTALLLATLLGAALLWGTLTKADLVVREKGRVRPATSPQRVAPLTGGRVSEVHYHLGQRVKQGEVLIKLDTEQLDDEIRKQERALRAA